MTPAEQRVIDAALAYFGRPIDLAHDRFLPVAREWLAAIKALLAERAQQASPAPACEEDGA